ncbi:MAG TPA: DUF262 domain-containing protein [Candidatus Acidoferrales bacterium]|nr:DUF262 domain-containing protein [Candidatus Acidoferrales bacterium]
MSEAGPSAEKPMDDEKNATDELERGEAQVSELSDGSTGVEIEVEEPQTEEEITQPFDPTMIRVESKLITIDLLLTRIREAELNLTPDFQRKSGIWTEKAQSRLIESILIRIPLPAFYMDATNDEKWLVVDGLQRLTTLKRFVIDSTLRLMELEFLKELNGKHFHQLSRSLQRRIKETQVTVYLIQEKTPSDVKFNIFKRINTGGLPLSPQEIRHALNQGAATRLLRKLADSPEFKRATDNGIRDDRMADRECVLRCLAFTLTPATEYRVKDFDSFLNESMAFLNRMSEKDLADLEHGFYRSIRAARILFGRFAFRKRYQSNAWRYPINKALFEVWSANLNKLDDNELRVLEDRKVALNDKFMKLMAERDFENSISQGTGDIRKVQTRFSEVEKIIREVLR